MDENTKRSYRVMGEVMGLLIFAGFKPAFDWNQVGEVPEAPTIKLVGVSGTKTLFEKLEDILVNAGFTEDRNHVRPGGSPYVLFLRNPETGDEVGLERDISGDSKSDYAYIRISVEL
jgi:hypothetical protein